MAEIKTLEQYVLARVQELEDENASLKINLAEAMSLIDDYTKGIKALKKYVKLRHLDPIAYRDKNGYIRMEDVDAWRDEQVEDFDEIIKLLDLVDPNLEKDVPEETKDV